MAHQALLLRFRDLVTEPGASIAEHRRIMRHCGYVWWGWWARKHERVPRETLAQLIHEGIDPCDVVLFDTGLMRCYRAKCSRVVLAPSDIGVSSPDLDSTPEYYARGRYPAWFCLTGDITPVNLPEPAVLSRPTAPSFADIEIIKSGDVLPLERLNDERPTLWVISLQE